MTDLARRCLIVAILVSPPFAAHALETGASDLETLFGKEAVTGLAAPRVEWRPGRETVVWIDRTDAENSVLVEFDPADATVRKILDDAALATVWGDRTGAAPVLGDPVWRPDGGALLLGDTEDRFLYDFSAGSLTRLNAGEGTELSARFAPDGRRIAWVRDNDVWVYDLEAKTEIRLSDDGSETVFNGVLDWVYEEELAGRHGRAFEWSDDGSAIVWLRLDDGEIPVYHLVDLLDTHSRVTEQRYPVPGDPSPSPSLHLARFAESTESPELETIEFETPLPYVPRFGFTPDGDLWYQQIDRSQDNLQLVRVDLEDGSRTVLVDETDVHWIEPVDGLRFLPGGELLWSSRRGGFAHLSLVRQDGSSVDLSPGPWDVTALVGVDPDTRHAWYQAARPNATERRLVRVDLASRAALEITPTPGTHSAELSTSGGRLLVTSSSIATPPSRRVVNGDGSGSVEVPVDDPIPRIDYAAQRFVEIATDDGLSLTALLWLPPGFDETVRHPVVVYTYGGPHAQVARNEWPTTSRYFNHALANRGFVVLALDNRGSAARGRDFEGAIDGALGSSQLPDQLAGVAWLREQPWADPARIGIWGWSYGGYMTIYALTHAPGVFAAGAAVAPVTDWRLYDSIYTERYMDTPETNPAGYAAGSVLDAVAELGDPLLVIHGTGDDNVHIQHTLQFADRAWRAGVRFDLMVFPNLAHGIDAPGSHLQVFSAIADFFQEHLMEQGETEP